MGLISSIGNYIGNNLGAAGQLFAPGITGGTNAGINADNASNQANQAQTALNTRLAQGNIQPNYMQNQTVSSVAANPYLAQGVIKPQTVVGTNATAPTVAPSSNSLPSGQSTYSQNLAKYNLTSVPAGYSFSASGKLTNNAGQEYPLPSSTGSTGSTGGTGSTSSPSGVNSTGTSAGSGTGGGAAPAGMMYDGNGALVPISSSTGSTGAATNPMANPYTSSAPSYSGLIGSLATTASQPSAAFTQAQNQYLQANKDLATSQENEANQLALNNSNPIPLEFQQGRGQVLQGQYQTQQAAISGQLSGAAAAEQAATGQQSAQQSGLAAAATGAAPQAANALGTFNPTTGTYSGYGGTSGSSGVFGAGQVLGGLAAGQNQVGLQQAATAAQGYAQTIDSYLQENPGLNPTGSTLVNGLTQWLQNGQFGDPKYQTLANYLTEYTNTLAPILGAGGSVTDFKNQLSKALVNGQASGQSISQVIAQLEAAATAKLQNYQNGVTGAPAVGGTSVANVQGGTNSAIDTQSNTNGATFGSFFGS